MTDWTVSAFDQHECLMLGNLDGQTAVRCSDFSRTDHFKALKSGHWPNGSVVSYDVKFWDVVDGNNKLVYRISNPVFPFTHMEKPHGIE